jgi:2-polyprenyl-6-methoxyphenol hydroxylase-like FAD-dependent oxidoreductase
MSTLVAYDELVPIDRARRRARSLAGILPDVPGLVAIGHPEMRQALVEAAAASGAIVVRGVEDVAVTPGASPMVSYTVDGRARAVNCRLVIAADGKESAVRRALGVELSSTTPTMLLTGLLVDDGGVWDRAEVTIRVHGENQLYLFPRVGALRLYAGRMVDAERFTGPDRQARMLDAFRTANLPHAEELANARPIGPCATFPMTDTWTRRPYRPGVVLAGDAAGWSNPVTGQGLAVAFRDAKVLTDLLVTDDQWSEALLDRYAAERDERMRRLRFASALTDLLMAQGVPDRAERKQRMQAKARRHPEMLAALDAVHRGPWRVPADAFEPSILTSLAL